MAKIGKAKKSSAKSDVPEVSSSAYHDKDHLERKEKRFDKDYGFTKDIPVRSPVNSEWEQNEIAENEPFMSDYTAPYLKKEQAIVAGHAHGFGHKGKQMHPSGLRLSGNKSAHRIGAKRK